MCSWRKIYKMKEKKMSGKFSNVPEWVLTEKREANIFWKFRQVFRGTWKFIAHWESIQTIRKFSRQSGKSTNNPENGNLKTFHAVSKCFCLSGSNPGFPEISWKGYKCCEKLADIKVSRKCGMLPKNSEKNFTHSGKIPHNP